MDEKDLRINLIAAFICVAIFVAFIWADIYVLSQYVVSNNSTTEENTVEEYKNVEVIELPYDAFHDKVDEARVKLMKWYAIMHPSCNYVVAITNTDDEFKTITVIIHGEE